MKKNLLILLLSLLWLPHLAGAQKTSTQRVARRDCRTCPVLYYFTTHVPAGTYPLTPAGQLAFETAANAGQFEGICDNGAVIPAGTKPPRTQPDPVTACNYDLAVTGAGTVTCGSARQLAVTATGANATGLTYAWSGNGATGIGTSINLNAPPTVGTYTYTVTVGKTGCTAKTATVQLVVTGCQTAPSYARSLVVGNSITLHGGTGQNEGDFIVNAQKPQRGMAATAPEKDFVRLLTAKLQTGNPSVDARTLATFNLGGTLDAATGPFMEGQLTKSSGEFYGELNGDRFNAVVAWKPSILYMRLGENVDDDAIASIGQTEFRTRYKAFVDKLTSGDPTCKVVLSTSVWAKPQFDAAMRAIATERNYPLADFSDMWPNRMSNGLYALNPNIYSDAGVNNHPDDDGMARIANDLWTKTPGTSVVPPVDPPVDPAGFAMYPGDNFNYTPLAETSSTIDPYPVFETDKIKVTLALPTQYPSSNSKGMGGSVFQIYNKVKPGKTLVYNALIWNGENDANFGGRTPGLSNRVFTGQGLSECLYQNPRPFYTIGETGQPAHDPSLGYNPNEVGDDVQASGRLKKYGRTANGFYTEMTPMIYGQRQAPASDVTFKKWGEVKDRALILNYESLFNRNSSEQVVSKGQEAPCLYVNNMRHFKWYSGADPYTNGGITTLTAPLGNGNGGGGSNGQRPGGLLVSEPWVGVFGDDGYGIGLILKDNIRSTIGYWGDGGGNDAEPNMGGAYGYIAHSMNEMLDMNIRWRHRTEVVVGTVDEIRAYVYANSYRPDYKPNFKFNKPGRLGWTVNPGDGWADGNVNEQHTWDEHYNGQNRAGWKVFFGKNGNAAIASPGVIWKASTFNKVYIRMAYTGETQNWEMRWVRNGQKIDGNLNTDPGSNKYWAEENLRFPNGTADRDAQKIYRQVIGDGQYRVYEFDMSGRSEWKDVINQIMIKPHATSGRYSYNAGESVIIDWISSDPNGPAN